MSKFSKIIALSLLLAVITTYSDLPVLNHMATVQAATAKLSETNLIMTVRQAKSLTVAGTSDSVTWSTNHDCVATVSENGKVQAVSVGYAEITALAGSKELTCLVTVIENNTYLKNSPFSAKVAQVDDVNFLIPADWSISSQNLGAGSYYTEILPPAKSKQKSLLRIDIRHQEDTPSDYKSFKNSFRNQYTLDSLTPQ